MQVTPIDERTSAVLDVMRCVAALAVVLTHVNDKLFLYRCEFGNFEFKSMFPILNLLILNRRLTQLMAVNNYYSPGWFSCNIYFSVFIFRESMLDDE